MQGTLYCARLSGIPMGRELLWDRNEFRNNRKSLENVHVHDAIYVIIIVKTTFYFGGKNVNYLI